MESSLHKVDIQVVNPGRFCIPFEPFSLIPLLQSTVWYLGSFVAMLSLWHKMLKVFKTSEDQSLILSPESENDVLAPFEN